MVELSPGEVLGKHEFYSGRSGITSETGHDWLGLCLCPYFERSRMME